MASFHGGPVEPVEDETTKPRPAEYPALLPTLQTWVGMVTNGGLPQSRISYLPSLGDEATKTLLQQAKNLRSHCHGLPSAANAEAIERVQTNLMACSLPVTKSDILEYIRRGKRVDTEQAVAMVIAYLAQLDLPLVGLSDDKSDDFEGRHTSGIDELINDPGTVDMLAQTCMWRVPTDFHLLDDAREASILRKKNKILHLLGEAENADTLPMHEFTSLLQTLRRKRHKLGDSQRLTMPEQMLPEPSSQFLPLKANDSGGKQDPISIADPRVISKNVFRKVQRLLYSMQIPTDVTAVYVLDVERFIKDSGILSPRRLASLEASQDGYAIAYSFIAVQRQRQLKVVSDKQWSRFLVKGEGKMLLQNRPDVLTSFEDILVRRAADLVALTAARCPKGVRDHFTGHQEIKDRARGVCELMERYVKDFGNGKMENLVYTIGQAGGSGRGPVDLYNALCDELRDCRARAKGAGMSLDIPPVHKFLAKDIMMWNKAWADDAFAGGKVPGWVEYLARVRMEEMGLDN